MIHTEDEARAWRPEVVGWSDDILPYYAEIAEWVPEGGQIVEVGVAHGRSALFLEEALRAMGKAVEFYAVDTSPCPPALAGSGITYMHGDSVEAAGLFSAVSLDLVFIDADHSLEGVRADIRAWRPKVRPGGRLAGHDYSIADWPGVVEAVDEAFGHAVRRPGRSIWEVRL